jgi:hypothetical protein
MRQNWVLVMDRNWTELGGTVLSDYRYNQNESSETSEKLVILKFAIQPSKFVI